MTFTDFSSLTIYSPFTGELHPIDDTPDEVFSSKVTGDGFCVFPSKGEVTAPTNGTITYVFDTNHALVLHDNDGVEYLLHIGIDTIRLGGRGFTIHVTEGDTVTRGDTLLTFDRELLRCEGYSDVCVCAFTDLDDTVKVAPVAVRDVKATDPAVQIVYRKDGE